MRGPAQTCACAAHGARRSSLSPHLPHTVQPPPPTHLPAFLSPLPVAGGRAPLSFSASAAAPLSLSFRSPLTKSLCRLDAAENHMACDITGAGSEERGMVESGVASAGGGGGDWLARSLCGDVSRKALWEARWGGESRAGWKLYPFLSDFTPTWIIRD